MNITPQSTSKRLASGNDEAAQVELFLTKKAGEKFAVQNGREPNAAEQQEIRKALDSSFPLVQRDQDAAEEDAEQLIFDKICSSFEVLQGRTPKVKDLESILGQLKSISKKVHTQDEEKEAVKEYLREKAVSRFEAENGRQPTSPEKKDIDLKLDGDFDFELENKEETEEDAAEQLIFERLCSTFQKAEGRAPDEQELEEILKNLKRVAASPAKAAPATAKAAPAVTMSMQSLKNLESGLDSSHTEGSSPPAPVEETASSTSDMATQVLNALMAEFKQKNGRDATETEVKQWMQTLQEANLNIGDIAGSAEEGPSSSSNSKRPAEASCEQTTKKSKA